MVRRGAEGLRERRKEGSKGLECCRLSHSGHAPQASRALTETGKHQVEVCQDPGTLGVSSAPRHLPWGATAPLWNHLERQRPR